VGTNIFDKGVWSSKHAKSLKNRDYPITEGITSIFAIVAGIERDTLDWLRHVITMDQTRKAKKNFGK
jgi:hypothetical protein